MAEHQSSDDHSALIPAALAHRAPDVERAAATVYDALVAALEHERACYHDYLQSRQVPAFAIGDSSETSERWDNATALVAEVRAVIAGEGRER